jgi:hypothetical protein
MRTLMLAAVAALSLSAGVAYANEGGVVADTPFTELPGVVTQAPIQNAPAATAQHEQTANHSPWLFPPIGKYLSQHAG